MSEPLRLPVEMTIYTASDTAAALRAWLDNASGEEATEVRGDAVAEIDGAGLQLLAALHSSLAGAGRPVTWTIPSPTLRRACRMLGPGAPFNDDAQGDAP